MSVANLIALGWAVIAVIMAILWMIQRAKHNAGIVDIAWSFGTGLLAVLFAAGADGYAGRRVLVAVLAGLWGARLGVYLLRRVLGEAEDGRYRELRAKWGGKVQPLLFAFFQVQAVWAVLFAIPMLVAAMRTDAPLDLLDAAGAAVWLVAVAGESIADRQLARFRRDPANRGAVCRSGLWRYSRHPNYFFEWVHWWAYVLIGIAGPYGWITLAGPALMLLFLFKITGIPPTEKHALESRGEAYREYQRTTSVFVPWPPRRTSPS
jgi:steroid 5-alpha reductase family enzyme